MLSFHDVTYRYGRRKAPVFSRFSCEFPSGRTVLLGPNGAGKSTLMSLAIGWRRPQSGMVRVGRAEGATGGRVQARLGFMPQDISYVPGLTVSEQVQYSGWLKGMRVRDAREKSRELLSVLELEEKADASARALSGGQLRRLGLAMALVHSPRVVILDEPTAGLDPAQRANFRSLISTISDRADMIISTHQVDDIEVMYTHVAVLVAGQIVWAGTPPEFLQLGPAGPHQAEIAFQTLMSGAGQAA
ncbi:UNVERIFIED_CONTAM: ATP-binding cassette domain-containing protein [Microbacterium sp. SLM126]